MSREPRWCLYLETYITYYKGVYYLYDNMYLQLFELFIQCYDHYNSKPHSISEWDTLPSKLLKAATPGIAYPLSTILNKSLQSGQFITEWNHAKVIPLFKSGPSMDTNNYRPIYILPTLSKLLERFVHYHFTAFLEEHKLLTVAQSGFRKQHSTVTSLLNVTDCWLRNIDRRLVTWIVFIDL